MREEEMELSTYINGNLKADTVYQGGHYGARFYDKEGNIIKTEFYQGHSETYAENAAENYVFGIKVV